MFPALIVWLYARQTGMGTYIFTPLVLIIVVLGVSDAAFIKPEIISLVFFALVSFLYFQIKLMPSNKHKWRLFLLFPFIYLLWVNIHGVVFFGLLLLAAIICGELINFLIKSKHAFIRKDMTALIISGILSAAATLLNPYGIRLHQNFINMSIQGMDAEMASMSAYQPLLVNIFNLDVKYSAQYWGIMACLLAIMFFANVKKTRNWDFGLLVPNIFLGTLFLYYLRTTFYWPAFWAMSLMYLSGRSCLNLPALLGNAKPLARYSLLCALAAVSLFLSLRAMHRDYYIPRRFSYFGLGFNYFQPVQESAFLKKHKIGTKLFNSYNLGSYLLHDLYPTYKVFVDTRYFPYKKDNTIVKYSNMAFQVEPFERLESEFGYDIALMEHSFPVLNNFIISKDWKPVFYGTVGVVFVKNHIDPPADIRSFDRHRFDGLKNLPQTIDVVRTAINLNDLETAAHVISIMEQNLSHLFGYDYVHKYLTRSLKGLNAYYQGDYEKALQIFWNLGFTVNNLRVNLFLRQLINQKVDIHIKKGQYANALKLLHPILENYPDDRDIKYDLAVVAFLSSMKDQSDYADHGIKWRALLQQWLVASPDHAYATIAKQLLENNNIPEKMPLILNSNIRNEELRTFTEVEYRQ